MGVAHRMCSASLEELTASPHHQILSEIYHKKAQFSSRLGRAHEVTHRSVPPEIGSTKAEIDDAQYYTLLNHGIARLNRHHVI